MYYKLTFSKQKGLCSLKEYGHDKYGALQLTPIGIKVAGDKLSCLIIKASNREDAIRSSKSIEIKYETSST